MLTVLLGKARITGTKRQVMDILEGLNDEQSQVVQHLDGPCLVLACPGAGKTESVMRRMAYLVKHQAVEPDRVLGLTFGREAASEMDQRIKRLLGDNTTVRVQTFHSFCWRVLAEHVKGFRDLDVDDGGFYRETIKKATGYENMHWDKADVQEIGSFIEIAKSSAFLPDSIEAKRLAETRFKSRPKVGRDPGLTLLAYKTTEMLREAAGFLTYSDWLVMVHKLFAEKDDVRRHWAAKFQYVIVDEAQDNNDVQALIARHIAIDHRNLMMVGDDKQCLYGFRGSKPEGMLEFARSWDAKVIRLGKNYRSVPEIVRHANMVSCVMRTQREVHGDMTAVRGEAGAVEVSKYGSGEKEAEGVADSIQVLQEDGAPWSNMTVLYRVNSMSRAIEEELSRRKIPYRVSGSSCFYFRKEVAGLIAYLKVANRKGSLRDVETSLRNPWRFLGKQFSDYIVEACKKQPSSAREMIEFAVDLYPNIKPWIASNALQWASLIDSMRADVADGKGPSELLAKVVVAVDYHDWIRKEEGKETPDNDRVANVSELIDSARRFATVPDFLAHVAQQIEAAKKPKDKSLERQDAVNLTSVHKAKGLEWPHVFVIKANEGKMPHFFAEDEEEERRIFYVAITRAKDALHISYLDGEIGADGSMKNTEKSRFLDRFPAARNLERKKEDALMFADASGEDDGDDDGTQEEVDGRPRSPLGAESN